MDKTKLIPLTFICFLFSCAPEVPITNETSALSINNAEVMARGTKDEFVYGDGIGVFVVDSNGRLYNDCPCSWNNKATLNNSSVWELKSDIYLDSSPGTTFAYYPYNEVTASLNQPIESASQTDYLYSSEGDVVTADSPVVTLKMQHALSLISFRVKKDGYVGEGNITNVSLLGVNMEGTLNISSGSIAVSRSGNEAYSCNFHLQELTPTQISIISLPQSVISTSVVITIDGEKYGYQLPQGVWSQGKEVTYTLGINSEEKRLFSVGRITIDTWGIGGNYEGNLVPGIDVGTEIVDV